MPSVYFHCIYRESLQGEKKAGLFSGLLVEMRSLAPDSVDVEVSGIKSSTGPGPDQPPPCPP